MQSKYATLTALQNPITNINNTINNEIQPFKLRLIILKLVQVQGMSVRIYHIIQTIQILRTRRN